MTDSSPSKDQFFKGTMAEQCRYWHHKTGEPTYALAADEIDRLEQDAARDASARDVMSIEMEGLRERIAECIQGLRDASEQIAIANQTEHVLRAEIEKLRKQLSARLQQIEELKAKLTAAEQLAVRQGNEIRKLRAGERA